jgi:HK97 family phage portal protein
MSLFPARPIKSGIDQQAQAQTTNGLYVRLDDRSTFSPAMWDAQGSALSISTVYACVRVLAESVASLPLLLYRRLPNGGKERALDHRLYETLHDAPNPHMTSFVWRELMMSHLATWGNHYSEIVLDEFDRLTLWPIRPDRMDVKYNAVGEKVYIYLSPTGMRREIPSSRIFHVPGLSSNGLMGLSPIALHAKTLQLSTVAQDYGTNFLRNGARPAIVLSHPKNLSEPAQKRLAAQMDELRGSQNAGRTVILEEGLTVTEVGVPPEDAQYIETRKFQRGTIASEIFRIPPHKIGDLEHATFSNIEHQAIEFVVDTLRPWLVRIEQECKAQLLYGEDVFAEFLIDGLLRGDSQARATALQIERNAGIINGDEWREIENMNPIEDGSGKVYWMPVNYQAALTPAAIAAAAAAPVEPAADPSADPTPFPALRVVKSAALRCAGEFRGKACNALLAEVATPPYRLTCDRCKTVAEASADDAPGEAEPLPDPMAVFSELAAGALDRQSKMSEQFMESLTDVGSRPIEVHVAAPPASSVTFQPRIVMPPAPAAKAVRKIVRVTGRDSDDRINETETTEVPI